MKKLLFACCLLFLAIPAFSQVSPQISGAGAPTNPCINGGQQYVDTTNHLLYGCPSNGSNWALLGIGNIQANTATTTGVGAPAGNCFSSTVYYLNTSNGDFYDCPTPGGAWVKVNGAGGGGGAFNTITAGTNTNALLVGTGGTFGPTGTGTITATAIPFSGVTAGINTTAGNSTTATSGMQVSGTATLSPASTGQLASSQAWYQNGPGVISPIPPTLAFSATGGALAATTWFFKVTYVGLAVIEPSGEVKITTSGCGASVCQITATMPVTCTAGNLPAGATGCTVWDSTSTGTEKQQAASNACVNITTATCVVNTGAVGSTLTTPQTGITPAGAQTITCPNNIIPTNWFQASDSNFYNLAGIDVSALNLPSPAGTFTWCHRFFVNDTSGPPVIANALVSIHHQSGNLTNTGSNVDDRALGIEMIDSGTASPINEQSLTQYNERIVSNNAFTCAPVGAGAPYGETCAAAGRFVTQDLRTSSAGTTFYVGVAGNSSSGTSPVQASGFANGEFIGGSFGANQQLVNNPNGNGAIYVGVEAGANGISGNTASTGYAAILVPPSVRFATQNIGLWLQNCGVCTNSDLALRGDSTLKWKIQGPLYLGAATSIATNSGTMGMLGSMNVTGSLGLAALTTPAFGTGSITNIGTPGASSNSYKLVAIDGSGNPTAASVVGTNTTGNATLNGTNFNRITGKFCGSGAAFGYTRFDVYRTAAGGTPSTTGKIGTISPAADLVTADINALTNCNATLDDVGLAGDGTTPPTGNLTGAMNATVYQSNTNCSSSASPAVCGSAAAGSVAVPTGTNATLQINTTAVTANSQIFMQSDDTLGTKLGVTCNTTLASLIVEPVISARSAAVSFTVTISGTTTVNPICLSYFIVN